MDAPALYAAQLIRRKEGYPLWEPDPKGRAPVEIADVGYIKDGAFLRLFNASKAAADPSNEFGVPDGYVKIEVGPLRERNALSARVPIVMGSEYKLQVKGHGSGGLPGTVSAGADFKFERSKSAGAILILRKDAKRSDIRSYGAFLRYICENHAAWLALANKAGNDFNLTLNDLLLVTGCDKTTGWACAAFSESFDSTAFNFHAGQEPVAGVGAGWGRWNFQAQSPYAQVGPATPTNIANQCVFVRGYKVCDRASWLAVKARLKTHDKDGFELVSPGCFGFFCCGSRRRAPANTDKSISRAPPQFTASDTSTEQYTNEKRRRSSRVQDRSHVDTLLYYMLETNKEAKLAVAHHDDLVPLLESDEDTDDFDEWLHRASPAIYIGKDHVAMLASGATHKVLQRDEEKQEDQDEMEDLEPVAVPAEA